MTPRLKLCIAGLATAASLVLGAGVTTADSYRASDRIYLAQNYDPQRVASRDDRLNYNERLRFQQLLRALGYRPGPIDGVIGPRTRRAARNYRRDKGLRPNRWITFGLMKVMEADYAGLTRNRPVTRQTNVYNRRAAPLDRMDALRSTAPTSTTPRVTRRRTTTTPSTTTTTIRRRRVEPPATTTTTPSFRRNTEPPEADRPDNPGGGWN